MEVYGWVALFDNTDRILVQSAQLLTGLVLIRDTKVTSEDLVPRDFCPSRRRRCLSVSQESDVFVRWNEQSGAAKNVAFS